MRSAVRSFRLFATDKAILSVYRIYYYARIHIVRENINEAKANVIPIGKKNIYRIFSFTPFVANI